MSTKTESSLPKSRLQRFLDEEGLTSAQLEAETGISRQSMRLIRAGRKDVRRQTMVRILRGARTLTARDVQIQELFNLDTDDPQNSNV